MAIKVRKRGENGDSPEDDEEQPEEQGQTVAPSGSDPFMRGSMRTLSWLADNQMLVLTALGVAILLGIGAYIGSNYMRQQSVEASKGVSNALRAFEVPVEGSPTLAGMKSVENAAPPGKTYASEKEKWQDVYKRSGTTLSNHESARVAQMARITRASAGLRLGKAEEAVELYRAYLDGERSEEMVPFVYYGLAVALADAGKYQKAVETMDKMIEADDSYESFALYHKGLFAEEAGEIDRAKKFYNKVLETDPESPYKTDINRRLALL